ncbi:transglutaminase-like domain-containing protein [Cohnella candidum]|uniref:Transglutaminase family protein n=1 Tax=Cohnella candidum TaxID=2674991 RepID=A0A3G3K1D8_9BACL|nr:transglutaminase family protein [Cohnella candidum]AYQ74375.1 transglutaminase family protein [Cohnella candidum]
MDRFVLESDNLEDYLAETEDIDYSNPAIRATADELFASAQDEIGFAKAAFEFVRDRVPHSWDIQGSRVTCRASDVLLYGEGICYAKSNLLCALLRRQGVPAGFSYQRLTWGDTPDTGYCLHALNAVYIRSLDRWVRLDARGNKPGIDARFSLEEERLAFPVRDHYGEIDYPTLYAYPHPKTLDTLKRSSDVLEMYRTGLPTEL